MMESLQADRARRFVREVCLYGLEHILHKLINLDTHRHLVELFRNSKAIRDDWLDFKEGRMTEMGAKLGVV